MQGTYHQSGRKKGKERKSIAALNLAINAFFKKDVTIEGESILVETRYQRPFIKLRSLFERSDSRSEKENTQMYYHIENDTISPNSSHCVYMAAMCLFGTSLKGNLDNGNSVSLLWFFRWLKESRLSKPSI